MIVTPGYLVQDNELVTPAKLRSAASPTIELEPGDVAAEDIDLDSLIDRLGTGASGYNYFDNPNLAENRWSRGTTAVSCPAGQRTLRADGWWVRPAGAAVTYERDESGPNGKSLFSAKVTGAASVTTVDFGQDIARTIATALAGPLVLSFWLYNNTGASVTPSVLLSTCDAADNFGSVTLRLTQALTTAAPSLAWTQFTAQIDAAALANIANGLQVVVRVPSGTLTTTGKSVHFAQLKLELSSQETASPFVVEREASADAGTGTALENLAPNGQLERFLMPPGPTFTCATGGDTYPAESFWVQPAGGSVTAARSTTAPDNELTGQSLLVTGGSGATTVQVGQNLAPVIAAKCRRPMVLSLWVRYHDGIGSATVTPTLTLATPAADADWAAAVGRVTVTLDPCVHDTWTRLSYAFDGSGLTDIAMGLRWFLEWPSGSLDASGKNVLVAQVQLEAGLAASDFRPYPAELKDAVTVGSASGLVVRSTGGGALSLSADELVLRRIDGRPQMLFTLSVTGSTLGNMDTGTASTGWYFVWVVAKDDGTYQLLISLSATAPALPAGYVAKALVSTCYYDSGTSAWVDFYQMGRTVWQKKQTALAGVAATTLTLLALNNLVPTIAKSVFGTAGVTGAASGGIRISADSSGGNYEVTIVGTNATSYNNFLMAAPYEVPLFTAQTVWYEARSAVNYRIEVAGYKI